MRLKSGFVRAIVLVVAAAGSVGAQELFDIPLRICMGGVETVDSHGRTWLGEGPGPGDPLNIRPNDAGGNQFAENWSLAVMKPDSFIGLGFDPAHAGDQYIFNTIRWDVGVEAPDFLMEIPIPNGTYLINMYFNEACCSFRHFKISIQGTVLDEDVSYVDYDAVPDLGKLGRLSFPGIVVTDKLLKIGLLPCSDCPHTPPPPLDTNAILNALEVLSGEGCDHNGLDFNCAFDSGTGEVKGTWKSFPGADSYQVLKNGAAFATLPGGTVNFSDADPRSGGPTPAYTLRALAAGGAALAECSAVVKGYVGPRDLACSVSPGAAEVALTWSPASAGVVTGYQVKRNGEVIADLPAGSASYEDNPTGRENSYSVQALPATLFNVLTCDAPCIETNFFTIPIRINMGGRETVDSHGNVWLGDGPGGGDPLCIRPDDASGTNWIENWTLPAFQPDSLAALGFDPNHAGDLYIFNTIRWDNGTDGSDFRLSLPVPDDEYFVNLYFNEAGGSNRHFKIELQGQVVDEDVSYVKYDPASPGFGRVGRLSYRVEAAGQGITIGLLPCPDCGAPPIDTNAIINAVEVLPGECAPGFRQCPGNLICAVDGTTVTGTWDPPLCLNVVNYEVRKDRELIQTLPGTATSFTDTLAKRVTHYEVKPVLAPGVDPCAGMICTAVTDSLPFDIPLRLNMGGSSAIDSRGRIWYGDGPGAGDPLSIRPDDLSGTNFIENWCTQASISQADSMRSLGFDPTNLQDQYIMNSIRWDNGADAAHFRMELPVPNDVYTVSLYFTECCCANRHFQIEMQDFLYDDDVSMADYDPHKPAVGRTGRLSFEAVEVVEGILKIALLPCPTCAAPPVDTNAIIDAIEVLPADTPLVSCPRSLVTSLAEGQVTGTWTPGENVTVTGYDVYREGVKIATLPANVTEFVDENPLCRRLTTYEVEPLSNDPNFLCPGMRMKDRVVNPDCPYGTPLRINMGGAETVDSHGDLWLGDGPGAGDPLGIRPDDLGGNNWIENWTLGVFKPDSLAALGFDPNHPGDRYIFNTIRWDNAGDAVNFNMEIPVDNGVYTVNLYFNEAGGPNRHFQIEIQGVIVDDDVSSLDYDPANPGVAGRVGRLPFTEIAVTDGILRISLLPCPACAGATDINPIINAMEILKSGDVLPAPTGLTATGGNGRVDLSWNAVVPAPAGYNVYHSIAGGLLEKLNETPVTATTYADVGLENGTERCYIVRAVSGTGVDGAVSNRACATPQGGSILRRGDVDANGLIDLSDPIQILNYLFLGGADPACFDAADTDDSGLIDITDAVNNLSFQFLGFDAPPAPGPFNCGPDPTAEVPELGCAAACQ